jgi:hypothetical protein
MPRRALTTIYSFTNGSDGEFPDGLVEANDGNLYGTNFDGGDGYGIIYTMTPSGSLTPLYTFCSQRQSGHCTSGAYPNGALTQHTNGTLYGTTWGGGLSALCSSGVGFGCGTFFSISVGLPPFVVTVPSSGKVGSGVEILGTNLAGATNVTFNGTAATFTVNATGTAISTTVPVDATTGTVQVVTLGGTLSSNVPFRVP